jgi:hypothetical protein
MNPSNLFDEMLLLERFCETARVDEMGRPIPFAASPLWVAVAAASMLHEQ